MIIAKSARLFLWRDAITLSLVKECVIYATPSKMGDIKRAAFFSTGIILHLFDNNLLQKYPFQ
jgi:hypothetical protein